MISFIIGIIIVLFVVGKFKGIGFTNSKGNRGERIVANYLTKLTSEKYIVINDVMVKTDYGFTQIDHVVVSVYGIFVIETKNYTGVVSGNENSEDWIKYNRKNKYMFKNPLRQNYGHIEALKTLLEFSDNKVFVSIIAFSRNANIKVITRNNVVYYNEVLPCILNYTEEKFSILEVSAIADKIKSSKIESNEMKKRHISEVKEKVNKKELALDSGLCPRCGGTLMVRNGKYGYFFGCSNYPKCKYTRPVG